MGNYVKTHSIGFQSDQTQFKTIWTLVSEIGSMWKPWKEKSFVWSSGIQIHSTRGSICQLQTSSQSSQVGRSFQLGLRLDYQFQKPHARFIDMENPACVYRWFPTGNPWVSYFARNYTHRLNVILETQTWSLIISLRYGSILASIFSMEGTVELTVTHTFFSTKDPGSHP